MCRPDPAMIKELCARALCDERTARKAFEHGTTSLQPLTAARLLRAAGELGITLPSGEGAAVT